MAILADESNLDLGEFLAYHFRAELREDEEAEREARVQVLSTGQIDCLIRILTEVRVALGSVYFDNVDEAIAYLAQRKIRIAEQAAPDRPPPAP